MFLRKFIVYSLIFFSVLWRYPYKSWREKWKGSCSLFSLSYAQEIQEINNKEDLFFLAQEAFEKGNYRLSLSYLEELLKIPENTSIKDILLYWMAECYFKENEFKKGKDYYSQIIRDFPNSKYLSSSLYSLGWCLFFESNFKEALNIFQKFLERYPEDKFAEDAHFKIIECLYNLKDYSKLKAEILLYLTKFPKTERSHLLSLYKAEALFYLDEYSDAKDWYQKVLDISLDSELRDLARLGKGYCLLKEGNFSDAKEEFSKVSLNSPNFFQARYLYGICLYNLEEFKLAYSIFTDLLQNSNLDGKLIPKIEFYISDCLFRIGQEKEALRRFKNLRIKYPDSEISPEVLYWLGDYYYRKKIFKMAERYFNTIISDFSESKVTPSSLYYLGRISLEEENYLQAKEFFLKAIKMNKELEILILPDLALIYRNLGEFQMAISSLKKAIEISEPGKDYSHWQFLIAEIFQEQKKFDEAISEYSKVHPDSSYGPKALLRIAKIYEDRERWKEAEDIYKKILKLDIQEKKFAQERLEEIQKK